MSLLAATLDWRHVPRGRVHIAVTSPVRVDIIAADSLFDGPVTGWPAMIHTILANHYAAVAAATEGNPMPIENRNGTCATCHGKIYRYPNKIDDDPETDRWAHLSPEDWVLNPHEVVPIPAESEAVDE